MAQYKMYILQMMVDLVFKLVQKKLCEGTPHYSTDEQRNISGKHGDLACSTVLEKKL